jgi:hypothetical protein
MAKTVKINKKDIPVEDILEIKPVFVSDTLFREVRYRVFEPTYHVMVELLDDAKGYKVELAVRKAMNKR